MRQASKVSFSAASADDRYGAPSKLLNTPNQAINLGPTDAMLQRLLSWRRTCLPNS